MGVLEGADLLDATKLLLTLGDLCEDDFTIVRVGGGLFGRKIFQFGLECIGLGHGIEQAGEESALLCGHLCRGCIVGDSAVTYGPDVLGAVDDEVLVDFETATSFGLCGDLGHEVLDDRAEGVAGSPDEEAIGDFLHQFGSIGLVDFSFDILVGDVLDHGLGPDFNVFFLEARFRVLNQLLAEHGEDIGESLDQGDMKIVLDLRNPLEQIFLEEILELAGEFDTGGATTDDNHVQKTFDLFRGLILEGGGLDTVHNLLADPLSIANFLQETSMFADTRDAKGSILSTNADDEHIKWNLGLHGISFDV